MSQSSSSTPFPVSSNQFQSLPRQLSCSTASAVVKHSFFTVKLPVQFLQFLLVNRPQYDKLLLHLKFLELYHGPFQKCHLPYPEPLLSQSSMPYCPRAELKLYRLCYNCCGCYSCVCVTISQNCHF